MNTPLFTDAELWKCHDFVIKLAVDAGPIITAGFYQDKKSFTEKTSRYDLVTETDGAVEKFVISAIVDKFPGHRFIGEETTAQSNNRQALTDDPTWVIDPIDGTMNFVHGHPHICLSIGLLVHKIPVIGVIYNPITNELYSARKGCGALRNGRPIRVSQNSALARSLLTTEFGMNQDFIKQRHAVTAKVLETVQGVRATGSTVLNMAQVATGAADCCYEFGLHCWDMAAATIIIREAGGVVLDTTGGDLDLMSRRVLCAATPELARELVAHIDSRDFEFQRD